MNKILSYNECVEIVKNNPNMAFTETKTLVDGFNVSMFCYFMISGLEIINNNAEEMRGITFIFNEDGSIFKHFLMLHKFFNLNENEKVQYVDLYDKKISNIYEKIDGSLISFINLPNGNIVAKTQMGFTNDQSKMAYELYENDINIQRLVNYCIENNYVPLFELISPSNQIVIEYDKTKLILLQIRNNKTGEYLNLNKFDLNGIETAKLFDKLSLDDLIELSYTLKDKEGWIVKFENGVFIKIKSEWYRERHHLFTETTYREDYLISSILDKTIDDILSMIPLTMIEKRNNITRITNIVNNYVSNSLSKIDSVIASYNGNIKEFVSLYKNDNLFPFYMKAIKRKDVFTFLKDYIKRKTFRLNDARNFLKECEK